MGTTGQSEPLKVPWMACLLLRDLPKVETPNKGVMDQPGSPYLVPGEVGSRIIYQESKHERLKVGQRDGQI